MQQKSNKKFYIIGGGLLLVLLTLAAFATLSSKSQQSDATKGTTKTVVDPVSHQTLVTQAGQSPETNGSTVSGPAYLGLSSLLQYGLTTDNIASLQLALSDYSGFKTGVSQVSLAVDDITQQSPSANGDASGRWSIKSNLVADNKKTYGITFFYDTSAIEVHLYDTKTGSLLYNSGVVDIDSNEGD